MAVNNTLQKKETRMGFVAYMTQDAAKKRINEVIGGENGTRFISAIVSAVNANPALQECTNSSILSGALLGESLKLSPSPTLGQYYLVPFNDRESGGKVAAFVIGYRGLLQLAIRSGYYRKLNVVAIKAGELIKFDPINEEIEVKMIEDDEAREAAETIGYYAMFEYTNGFRKAIYWSKKKMEAHAMKYSQTYKQGRGGFWSKDFDGMAFKTMLRQLISKWGVMSIDMQTAMASDNAAIKADMTPEYVDNAPDNAPDYMAKPEAPEIEEKPAEKVKKPAKEKAIKAEPENMNINAVLHGPEPAGADDAQADNEAMRALFG